MLAFDAVCHPQNNCNITESSVELHKKRRRRRHGLTCGVCGLPATYYHFGGAACESCRLFFRRAIQNDTVHLLKCDFGGHCTMTSTIPRKCSACRFSKCLSNGMDPRWVISAEERQKRREKWIHSRLTKHSSRDQQHNTHIDRMYDPDAKEISELLSESELTTVRMLVDYFKNVALGVRYEDILLDMAPLVKDAVLDFAMATHVAVHIIRLVDFAKHVLQIAGLESVNTDLLIQKHWCQLSSLRSTFEYDIQRKCRRKEAYFDIYTKMTPEYFQSRMSAFLLQKYAAFTAAVMKLQLDEPCVLLLMVISLLSTDNIVELTQVDEIEAKQVHFLSILRKYVQWRYGYLSVSVMYPKLLGLLTESQELNMSLNEKHYWIQDAELEYVEKKFGSTSPFREYSKEKRNRVFIPAATDSDDVVDDCTLTINMLHRGTISLYQGIQQEDAESLAPSENESQSSFDDEALSPITQLSEFDENVNDMVHYDLSLVSWSPEEFDLSLCEDFQ